MNIIRQKIKLYKECYVDWQKIKYRQKRAKHFAGVVRMHFVQFFVFSRSLYWELRDCLEEFASSAIRFVRLELDFKKLLKRKS